MTVTYGVRLPLRSHLCFSRSDRFRIASFIEAPSGGGVLYLCCSGPAGATPPSIPVARSPHCFWF